jgi:predicted NBD/HSP70 family sugar kinase
MAADFVCLLNFQRTPYDWLTLGPPMNEERPPKPRAKATKHDSRRHNLRTTLDLVSIRGSTTRAELARLTGLTRAAVSSLVGELIEDGLLQELGRGESAGGKPPTIVALNRSGRDIVALDLGRRPFSGGLVDLGGHIHHRQDASPTDPTGDSALEAALDLARRLIAAAGSPVLGIGVGTPGIVDAEGRVLAATNLDWHGLELGATLQRELDLPVSIANDAQVAALAELRRHPESGDSVLLVKIGRGVGTGVVLNTRLYRGEGGAAGEIGHVQVVSDGDPCTCGNRGCLETLASVPAILRRIGADPDRDPWDAIALTVISGEEALRESLRVAGRHLGAALAHAIALLDIRRVVIACDLRNAGEELVDEVRRHLAGRIMPVMAERVEVELSPLGTDLVLTGAAAAVLTDRLGVVLR